jgi:HAD superfamily hydrolase (TIGR01509 family)
VALVIFDCDGVLVDSELLVAEVEAELLGTEGAAAISVDDILARYVGISEPEMHRRIEVEWGIDLPADFAERKAARLDEVFEHSLRAVGGMPELVRALVADRCVASSSALPRIRRCLELTGLLDLFEPDIFSASMVAHGKPAPDLFLHAARYMQCAPADAVVVEDASYGVTAAVAAGITVIGFVGASHCSPETAEELRRAGAGAIARDADELRDLLERAVG